MSDFPRFRDSSLPPAARAADLLAVLTLEEKVALCHGGFESGGVSRLGIPKLQLMDGPVGIRLMDGGNTTEVKSAADEEVEDAGTTSGARIARTTALPGTLLLAATWDRQAGFDYAALIADEMLAADKHVLLAPGINLMRDPRGGRNFEYFGEDPFLTAEFAIAYTRGLQSRRVGANLKHFVGNECDKDRHYTSSNVDAVTLREIYAYPFERAIREADAWTVMTGNNLLNGEHVAESVPALRRLLRERLGFGGVVLTDWRSAYRARECAAASLDMTTGFCGYVYGAGSLLHLVESGELPAAELDAMAGRILTLYARVGLLDADPASARGAGAVDTPAHRARARSLAATGMVLLKNDRNLLPVPPAAATAAEPIVVTGPGALQVEAGTGSGLVNRGIGNVAPIEGLRAAYGEAAIRHVADSAALIAADELAGSPLVIYCANAERGGEGRDNLSIDLPADQIAEITRLGDLTPRLLVVLQTGSAVDCTPWHRAPAAILVAWYGGQAMGQALADLLTGAVSPSGKLPCTFGNPIADYPAAALGTWPARLRLAEHPGNPGFTPETRQRLHALDADYTEGLLIGYRWFDARNIPPVYPFGFGLSYTTFTISDLTVVGDATNGWCVRCQVRNTGSRAGAEVIQLYVSSPAAADGPPRPPRQLRGFAQVEVAPGGSGTAEMVLRPQDLATFDAAAEGWRIAAGQRVLHVGTSSRDLPLSVAVEVPPTLPGAHP